MAEDTETIKQLQDRIAALEAAKAKPQPPNWTRSIKQAKARKGD